MKIAIHHREGSFSTNWIEYCKNNNILFKIVNGYDTDIIEKIEDCDAFMWHHNHVDNRDALIAKQILFSIEQSGKKVFPDFKTSWHFDDKLGQKYLFEAIKSDSPKSYAFYDKEKATDFLNICTYPIVFKLRRGAGASNVVLLKNKEQGIKLTKRAFSKGFSQFNARNRFIEAITEFKKTKNFLEILKGIARFFIEPKYSKLMPKEIGYIYLQEFIENQGYDIRLIVIGNKAYGLKRIVREGDFRASGSHMFDYSPLPKEIVKLGFEISENLNLQCIAFDFIIDKNSKPYVIEMSYGFGTSGSSKCEGYWDRELNYYKGEFDPFSWMIDNLIKS